VASLLWGRWYHECLLLGVGVDLSGVSRLKACTWGSDCDLLLSSNSSSGVGVFTLLTLRVHFSVLRWYICRDDCRMDLPGPTASVGTRTDYSVDPWDYLTCAARYPMA
jgi:hypothetical protein